MITEEVKNNGKDKLKLVFLDTVQAGIAYLIVTDPVTEREHVLLCSLEKDKIEISKISIDLYLANGYLVTVVVNPTELASGFIAPPTDRSGLN